MKNQASNVSDPKLISYLTLRRAVGILGVAFPIVLVTGSILIGNCDEVQSSISAYYHTMMRNIFVGLLCAIALFLYAYKGYNKADSIAGNLGCIFALGVAFFPTSITEPLSACIPEPVENNIISTIHFASAAGLFLVLSFFSIVLFTKKGDNPTKMKIKRNMLFRICGYIMLASIGLIALYSGFSSNKRVASFQEYDPIFWLETLALWAFGLSWLVKGRTIMTDYSSKKD
ncbi:MAG: hypothetical protein WD052_14415 [Bacteroidales bacterium]